MKYDSTIIESFAERLYTKADTIIYTYIILGIIIGVTGSTYILKNNTPLLVIMTGICGAIGYSMGSNRAFQLRLQAQTALCQVQIERNTQSSKSKA